MITIISSLILWVLFLLPSQLIAQTLSEDTPAIKYNSGDHFGEPLENLKNLARSGDIASQVKLAIAYEHGENVSKNEQKAIQWYCNAALNNSIDAQVNLAWMLMNARGVTKDEAQAAYWFKKAAHSGDAYAQKMLVRLVQDIPEKQTLCVQHPKAYWQTKRCSAPCQKVVTMVNHLANKYKIDSLLVLAIIQQESKFNAKAQSHKGAMGLMQLQAATAKRFAITDIWDTKQNITGGIRYLLWLLKRYQGDVSLTLAGYNAGEQAVDRYKGIPPYKETQNYVSRIMAFYGKTHHPIPSSTGPSTGSTIHE
jgi:soluble lytic murein transglycosylase-like protein